MNRLVVASLASIFILGILVGIFFDDPLVTGEVVDPKSKDSGLEYTYTKAICNSNKCVDVVINCSGGNITEIKPISEVVEFDENWTDLRNDTGKLC